MTSPKRQKTEISPSPDDYDSDDVPEEEYILADQEVAKSDGFEIDFSKFKYWSEWKPLDLEDDDLYSWGYEDQTNRDFAATLANIALTKHNDETGTKLKLVKVWRANFHPSAAATFYISFDVNDPSEDEIKPYRAVVRYFPGDCEAISCFPKPYS